jgi:hypothetical protein
LREVLARESATSITDGTVVVELPDGEVALRDRSIR